MSHWDLDAGLISVCSLYSVKQVGHYDLQLVSIKRGKMQPPSYSEVALAVSLTLPVWKL